MQDAKRGRAALTPKQAKRGRASLTHKQDRKDQINRTVQGMNTKL
jgi:hypothetical protein